MKTEEFDKWTKIFQEKAETLYPSTDPSHDFLHIDRVVQVALKIAKQEKADLNIVLPAAYFHDFVNVPKNDPRRKKASILSADAAISYLEKEGYLHEYLEAIHHAIAAHSFSANIQTKTIEAKVIQDADRLDAIGAVGIARCFSTGSLLKTAYYDLEDPLASKRDLDDKKFSIDHFFIKLFKLAETMQTEAGKREAQKRTSFMKDYIEQFKSEISFENHFRNDQGNFTFLPRQATLMR